MIELDTDYDLDAIYSTNYSTAQSLTDKSGPSPLTNLFARSSLQQAAPLLASITKEQKPALPLPTPLSPPLPELSPVSTKPIEDLEQKKEETSSSWETLVKIGEYCTYLGSIVYSLNKLSGEDPATAATLFLMNSGLIGAGTQMAKNLGILDLFAKIFSSDVERQKEIVESIESKGRFVSATAGAIGLALEVIPSLSNEALDTAIKAFKAVSLIGITALAAKYLADGYNYLSDYFTSPSPVLTEEKKAPKTLEKEAKQLDKTEKKKKPSKSKKSKESEKSAKKEEVKPAEPVSKKEKASSTEATSPAKEKASSKKAKEKPSTTSKSKESEKSAKKEEVKPAEPVSKKEKTPSSTQATSPTKEKASSTEEKPSLKKINKKPVSSKSNKRTKSAKKEEKNSSTPVKEKASSSERAPSVRKKIISKKPSIVSPSQPTLQPSKKEELPVYESLKEKTPSSLEATTHTDPSKKVTRLGVKTHPIQLQRPSTKNSSSTKEENLPVKEAASSINPIPTSTEKTSKKVLTGKPTLTIYPKNRSSQAKTEEISLPQAQTLPQKKKTSVSLNKGLELTPQKATAPKKESPLSPDHTPTAEKEGGLLSSVSDYFTGIFPSSSAPSNKKIPEPSAEKKALNAERTSLAPSIEKQIEAPSSKRTTKKPLVKLNSPSKAPLPKKEPLDKTPAQKPAPLSLNKRAVSIQNAPAPAPTSSAVEQPLKTERAPRAELKITKHSLLQPQQKVEELSKEESIFRNVASIAPTQTPVLKPKHHIIPNKNQEKNPSSEKEKTSSVEKSSSTKNNEKKSGKVKKTKNRTPSTKANQPAQKKKRPRKSRTPITQDLLENLIHHLEDDKQPKSSVKTPNKSADLLTKQQIDLPVNNPTAAPARSTPNKKEADDHSRRLSESLKLSTFQLKPVSPSKIPSSTPIETNEKLERRQPVHINSKIDSFPTLLKAPVKPLREAEHSTKLAAPIEEAKAEETRKPIVRLKEKREIIHLPAKQLSESFSSQKMTSPSFQPTQIIKERPPLINNKTKREITYLPSIEKSEQPFSPSSSPSSRTMIRPTKIDSFYGLLKAPLKPLKEAEFSTKPVTPLEENQAAENRQPVSRLKDRREINRLFPKETTLSFSPEQRAEKTLSSHSQKIDLSQKIDSVSHLFKSAPQRLLDNMDLSTKSEISSEAKNKERERSTIRLKEKKQIIHLPSREAPLFSSQKVIADSFQPTQIVKNRAPLTNYNIKKEITYLPSRQKSIQSGEPISPLQKETRLTKTLLNVNKFQRPLISHRPIPQVTLPTEIKREEKHISRLAPKEKITFLHKPERKILPQPSSTPSTTSQSEKASSPVQKLIIDKFFPLKNKSFDKTVNADLMSWGDR